MIYENQEWIIAVFHLKAKRKTSSQHGDSHCYKDFSRYGSGEQAEVKERLSHQVFFHLERKELTHLERTVVTSAAGSRASLVQSTSLHWLSLFDFECTYLESILDCHSQLKLLVS